MKKLFEVLKQCMVNGEDTVLVTVLASSGSTPRGAGARMLVSKNGRLHGTIGGGMVEYKSEQLALEILKEKKSMVKGYKLDRNQVEDLGMICGGDVTIYFQFIAADDRGTLKLVDQILNMFDRDEDSWIITDITDETAWSMGVYSKNSGFAGLNIDVNEAKPILTCRAVQAEIKDKKYYSEPLVKAGRVVIFGGGHISQELVPVLEHVGFRCVVLDDRKEFADQKLFPKAEQVKVVDFQNIKESVEITENDYVVIVTRGHSNDFEAVKHALCTDSYYIGMIGSKGKIAKTNERLIEAGIPEGAIERVYSPIGLSIKAETPAEIAISIAAEIIMKRAERTE